jgi:hypothetical protein
VADQRQVVVSAPVEPAMLTAAETGPLYDAAATPPRPTAVNRRGLDRTGSISAAAERCAIGQISASIIFEGPETAIGQSWCSENGRGSKLPAAEHRCLARRAGCWRLSRACDRRWNPLNAPGRGGTRTRRKPYAQPGPDTPRFLRDFSERHPGA